jgi:subtilisin family serine protease
MKKRLALVLSVALLPLTFTSHTNVYSQKNAQSRPLYVEGQVLVKLRADAEPIGDPQQAADLVLPRRNAGAEVVAGNPLLDHSGLLGGLYRIQLDSGLSVEEAVEIASRDPRVEYAEPNYLLYSADTMPNDERFSEQWGLLNDGISGKIGADIGAPQAWDLTTGSDEVVVAVIDTGADLSHPDLSPNAWVNPGETAGNNFDDDGNGFVDDISGWNFIADNNQFFEGSGDLHGTHVAGTIGAAGNNGLGVTGVAWHVKIVSLKFIGTRSGTTNDAIEAINYALRLRQRGVRLVAINASWGGPGDSQSLRNAIRAAGEAGILVVCASSNGGSDFLGDDNDTVADFPSSWSPQLSNIISIASLDRTDAKARSSNYGHSTVAVGAPGVSILSTSPGGGYTLLSGTSMATPHVTGIAALLWAREPQLTPTQVRDRIIRTAEPVLSLASKVISGGRANAANALADRAPTVSRLGLGEVRTSKKVLTVDGLGFVEGRTIIEVNGVALSKKTKYLDDYRLPSGAVTRITVKLGKNGMNQAIPKATQVQITAFDPFTNERSVAVTHIRN